MASLVHARNPGAQIGRAFQYWSSVSLTSGALGVSGNSLDMRSFAGGCISGSTAQAATTLTFFAAQASSTGPYRALYDSDGVAVTLTVAAARTTDLPAACFGTGFIRMQADTAGTYDVCLKG